MPWIAAVAAIGATVAGAINASNDRAAAQAAALAAYQQIQQVGAPPELAQQILLQHFQSAGILTPEVQQAITLGPSKVSQIQEDPGTKAAQMQALQQLQQRGVTGLSPEDRAAFNQMRGQVATDTQGKLQQIIQGFASRGQAGSGSELAAALAANQGGSNQASAEGDRLAGLSSQRALEATIAGGQLGGQVRAQDFDVARTQAQAADAVAQFNARNSQAVQSANVNSANAAQAANLQNAQQLQNSNTSMANQEAIREVNAQQQQWEDQMQQATAKANAGLGQATMYNNAATQQANQWQGMGSAVAQAGAAYGQYQNQQSQNAMMQQYLNGNQTPTQYQPSYDPNAGAAPSGGGYSLGVAPMPGYAPAASGNGAPFDMTQLTGASQSAQALPQAGSTDPTAILSGYGNGMGPGLDAVGNPIGYTGQ